MVKDTKSTHGSRAAGTLLQQRFGKNEEKSHFIMKRLSKYLPYKENIQNTIYKILQSNI